MKSRPAGTGAEEAQIVTGWLLRILLVLAVVAFLVFEFGSVLITRLQAGDIADQAASQAGCVWLTRKGDREQVEAAARRYAEEKGAKLLEVQVDTGSREVTATIEKKARSNVLPKIDAFKDWVLVRAKGSAPLPEVAPATCA